MSARLVSLEEMPLVLTRADLEGTGLGRRRVRLVVSVLKGVPQ